jgi:hypothetical protein
MALARPQNSSLQSSASSNDPAVSYRPKNIEQCKQYRIDCECSLRADMPPAGAERHPIGPAWYIALWGLARTDDFVALRAKLDQLSLKSQHLGSTAEEKAMLREMSKAAASVSGLNGLRADNNEALLSVLPTIGAGLLLCNYPQDNTGH